MSRLPWALMVAALALAASLGGAASHYRGQALTARRDLAALRDSVALQNQAARERLADLQSRRDAAQAALDSAYQQQEHTDAVARDEILRLRGELQRHPVRVRIQPLPPAACGPGGAGTPGDAATGTGAGAPDPAPSHGLLPAGNTARLVAVIQDIETLNAAYASCRASLTLEEPR